MTYKPDLPKNAGSVEWVGPDDWGYTVTDLIHCIRLPQEANLNDPAPAVVMTHGWSGDECAMWVFKQAIPKGAAVLTPRAPFRLNEGEFIWYQPSEERQTPEPDSFETGLSRLEYFITHLVEAYPIDPDRLVLIGFSQGGAINNSLVLRRPGLARGVASLSSFIPNGVEAEALGGLPVFIAHGLEDPIVPVEAGRRARDIFAEAGAEVVYGEYETGHKMSTAGLNDLKEWLADLLKK